jgi:hypothetical protein
MLAVPCAPACSPSSRPRAHRPERSLSRARMFVVCASVCSPSRAHAHAVARSCARRPRALRPRVRALAVRAPARPRARVLALARSPPCVRPLVRLRPGPRRFVVRASSGPRWLAVPRAAAARVAVSQSPPASSPVPARVSLRWHAASPQPSWTQGVCDNATFGMGGVARNLFAGDE